MTMADKLYAISHMNDASGLENDETYLFCMGSTEKDIEGYFRSWRVNIVVINIWLTLNV